MHVKSQKKTCYKWHTSVHIGFISIDARASITSKRIILLQIILLLRFFITVNVKFKCDMKKI